MNPTPTMTLWVRTDDPCQLLVSDEGHLVCPVHTGHPRPVPSRGCSFNPFLRLCHVCLSERVQMTSRFHIERRVCDACQKIDAAIATSLGAEPLTGITQDHQTLRRMEAYVTLVFPTRWRRARESGLGVVELDTNAPFWDRKPDRRVEPQPPMTVRHFARLDHWRTRGGGGPDSVSRRAAFLAWARAVHPASPVAVAAGEIP
ncbi:hypothetical protein [Cellulosimicrobium sp. NPDC055967]|uniref:hypothetical protein n=1 Tax=Cellulosimicrobium sp. NPDC055967 TaxID=3345670 RepID=UPI0035DEDFAB